MNACNPKAIYSAGYGDWTQARLMTVSGSARTVPMSHRDKPTVRSIAWELIPFFRRCEPTRFKPN